MWIFQTNEFIGDGCEVCFNHECQNGASCSNPNEIFECQCLTGFEGDLCQINIDDCVNHDCVNGSTCQDLINDYKCLCLPGYTGDM